MSSEQRPSPPTGSKKCIKKLKKTADTPFLCAFCDNGHLSFPFTPVGKLICQTDPFAKAALPGLLAECSIWSSAPVQAGKLFPASSAQLTRCAGPSGQRICMWCRYSDLLKLGSISHLLCAITFPGHKSRWNVCGCHRNLSGCSRGKTTLLKAIQRDPFVCKSSFQTGLGFFIAL